MTTNRTTVGIVGASGETGTSILNGLLTTSQFTITAFARPSSLTKPANQKLTSLGVTLKPLDLTTDSHSTIVAALKGISILISAVGPSAQMDQISLATAAKEAGVKRFIPCAFVTVMPVGVHMLRDAKEEVYNHVKRLGLGYTIIDVGWWYQISIPALPSGKTDYAVAMPSVPIAGWGNQLSGITDLRDIGKYVARIITDPRTENKAVFVYNELWSQNAIFDKLEELSGEKLPRNYDTLETLQRRIPDAQEKLKTDPTNYGLMVQLVSTQYLISWGIRGDNTPEYAKYLGYLTSKDLYPDFQHTKFEDYLKEVLAGEAKGVYQEMKAQIAASMKHAGS